jgi:hypothetical protein
MDKKIIKAEFPQGKTWEGSLCYITLEDGTKKSTYAEGAYMLAHYSKMTEQERKDAGL